MRSRHGTRSARWQFLTLLTATAVAVPLQRHGVVSAAPGDLDLTFGKGGRVATAVSQGTNVAYAMALHSDGRIVLAGRAYMPGADVPSVALARYNTDGTLDASFGNGGIVFTDIENGMDEASEVAIRPDGRIVVAAVTYSGGPGFSGVIALLSYNSDGTLDSTFGTGGIVLTNAIDRPTAMVLQPDGAIVVASWGTERTGPTRDDFFLTRYNANGSLDTSFGGDGRVTTDFGGYEGVTALVLEGDNRIVAYGYGAGEFLLARYMPDGALDPSFGVGGKVITTTHNHSARPTDLAIQPDGKLVAVGSGYVVDSLDFYVLRYNSDGSLDTSFSGDGKAASDFAGLEDEAKAVVVDGAGRILLAGRAESAGVPRNDFTVARFNTDGTLDTSFGNGGWMIAGFPGPAEAFSAALQPDEKLVVSGMVYQPGADFAMARFNAQP